MKQESESCVYMARHICLISFRQVFTSKWNTHLYRKLPYKQGFERSWEVKRLAGKYIKEGGRKQQQWGNISFSLFNWRCLVRSFWVCAPAPWPTRSLQGGRYLEVGSCREWAPKEEGILLFHSLSTWAH